MTLKLYAHPFSSYCQKALTALYENGTPFDYRSPTRLALLVQDTQGYLNLSELLGRSWTRNVQRAQAWVR